MSTLYERLQGYKPVLDSKLSGTQIQISSTYYWRRPRWSTCFGASCEIRSYSENHRLLVGFENGYVGLSASIMNSALSWMFMGPRLQLPLTMEKDRSFYQLSQRAVLTPYGYVFFPVTADGLVQWHLNGFSLVSSYYDFEPLLILDDTCRPLGLWTTEAEDENEPKLALLPAPYRTWIDPKEKRAFRKELEQSGFLSVAPFMYENALASSTASDRWYALENSEMLFLYRKRRPELFSPDNAHMWDDLVYRLAFMAYRWNGPLSSRPFDNVVDGIVAHYMEEKKQLVPVKGKVPYGKPTLSFCKSLQRMAGTFPTAKHLNVALKAAQGVV